MQKHGNPVTVPLEVYITQNSDIMYLRKKSQFKFILKRSFQTRYMSIKQSSPFRGINPQKFEENYVSFCRKKGQQVWGHYVPKIYDASSTRSPKKQVEREEEGVCDKKNYYPFLLLMKKLFVSIKFYSLMEDGVYSLIVKFGQIFLKKKRFLRFYILFNFCFYHLKK